jgi:endonuclease YncB( thermonuclease family)
MRSRRHPLPLRHGVAALGLAAIGWVVVTVASTPEDEARPSVAPPPAAMPAPPSVEPSARPTSAGEAPQRPEPPAVRAVTAPGITPFPISETPPTRIAPPEKPKPPAPPVKPRRLAPVAMVSTAEFTAGDLRIRLPGVAVTPPEEICRDRAGIEWPCGRRALAGVRALVRGRAVECPLPEKVRRGDFVVDCSIAGADLAARIVASGWARALDRESALAEVERVAEAAGLGLHAAAAPQAVDPFPEPTAPPPDATTAPIGAVEGPPARPAP